MNNPVTYSYVFDRYRLSTAQRKLLYEDHPIPLSNTQFKVLRILVKNADENAGHFIKRDQLFDAVFGKDSEADLNNIDQAITGLRGKLHDDKKRFIETQRGKGYRFVANVRKVPDIVTPKPQPDPQPRPEPDPGPPVVKPPPPANGILTFPQWRRGPGQVVKWVLIVGVILTVTISMILPAGEITSKWVMTFVSIAQFFVILFALVYPLLGPKGFRPLNADVDENNRLHEKIREATGYANAAEWGEARGIAKDTLEEYEKYWRGLLVSWLLLYGFLAFTGLPYFSSAANPEDPIRKFLDPTLNIATTLFNNLNTLMLVLCYSILNKPIVIKDAERKSRPPLSTGVGILIALTFIEALLVTLIGSSAGRDPVLKGFSWASGLGGGIAMALYVGRLQSKFLGPPRWLLILLYSYTAIQPLFIYLENRLVWAVILIDAALILKCLLYLYMAWLFQSGRLLFYLVRARRTYQRVEAEWQDFRQVLDQAS